MNKYVQGYLTGKAIEIALAATLIVLAREKGWGSFKNK